VVDQYAKIEAMRLRYFRDHQKECRIADYKGVVDALAKDQAAGRTGQYTVLPSSFTGGPRYMSSLYQDAMAMVRDHGKPDLFITFTCNPKWPEISAELMPGQDASDRPDLIVRVFNIKMKALLKDLLFKNILGKVIGYTWVVEFQKRGLPHVHILLILDKKDKLKTPEEINSVVSAELPDEHLHPLAYATVTTCMLHGPCGEDNPSTPCMKEDIITKRKYCDKGFPHEFAAETSVCKRGYPLYKRRDDKRTFKRRVGRRELAFDHRYVVPHNLYLVTKYSAHINVEVCSSVAAVKYLFKYVYKGHDKAEVKLHPAVKRLRQHRRRPAGQDFDEIEEYQDARYVSACEALWRISVSASPPDLHPSKGYRSIWKAIILSF